MQDAIDGFVDRQRAVFLDDGREVFALDIFHDHEVDAATLVGIKRLHDVRMREFCRCFDFALEPFDGRFVFGERRGEQLDRRQTFHLSMLSLEDLAHAARPDLGDQHILVEHQRRTAA